MLLGTLAKQLARPYGPRGNHLLGEPVARLANGALELVDPALDAGTFLAHAGVGPECALKPRGMRVERRDLLLGGCGQAGPLGGVRIARAAER